MKQDDYRKMCDEVKLSEEQKDKIWAAARAKVQAKKENRQKIGRFAGIAMAAAAVIVFFMVAAMPGIIRNKNTNKSTNQPAAQVEKSTEENSLQVTEEDFKLIGTRYYLLLGIDSRTEDMKDAQADAIILLGMNVNTKMVQVISIPNQFDLGGKKAVDYNWKDQGKDGLRGARSDGSRFRPEIFPVKWLSDGSCGINWHCNKRTDHRNGYAIARWTADRGMVQSA